MVHSKYYVRKLRFGSNGEWKLWEYEAVSDTPNYKEYYGEQRGISARHPTIDSLARELSQFPAITNANFVPEERSNFPAREKIKDCVRAVSMAISTPTNTTLTQWGTVSDDELGELASKIFQYYKERRE